MFWATVWVLGVFEYGSAGVKFATKIASEGPTVLHGV